ncbi:hypothetical protein PTSG_04662 [Salpingoeca rosetta]|uniref:Uncharacterized protein n=1 Tax=Salpingoeca rosetta (strain ATCC 50818 / BSB-021) TaxID=946362 RepID=F2U826_SALR5|nr:uncharacterized protein PTSG_04662 [Salpingoeca rosetta]EGD72931.1 hypothetical protein PTSG_04662 [Salpingoeca rosetta]|eukprot:XP_004994753.1 hypothetical protein PTSG_04662 [Salpingoeca rosetta]
MLGVDAAGGDGRTASIELVDTGGEEPDLVITTHAPNSTVFFNQASVSNVAAAMDSVSEGQAAFAMQQQQDGDLFDTLADARVGDTRSALSQATADILSRLESRGIDLPPLGVSQWSTLAQTSPTGAVIGAEGSILFLSGSTGDALVTGQSSHGKTDAFVAAVHPRTAKPTWITQLGTGEFDTATSVALDASRGRVFISGVVGNKAALPGHTSRGNSDIFAACLDAATGEVLWTQQLGTSEYDRADAIAVLPSTGDVVVTGSVRGSLPNHSISGISDVAVARLSGNNGSVMWTQQFGTNGFDSGLALAVPPSPGKDDRFYLAAAVEGPLEPNLPYGGGTDIAILCMDSSDGEALWIQQLGSSGADTPYGLTLDPSGVVLYVAAETTGSLGSDGYPGTRDAVVAKLNAVTGAVSWVQQYGSTSSDKAVAVLVDGNDASRLYAAMQTTNFRSTTPDNYKTTVVRLDASNGDMTQTRVIGSGSDSPTTATWAAGNTIIVVGSTRTPFFGWPTPGGVPTSGVPSANFASNPYLAAFFAT